MSRVLKAAVKSILVLLILVVVWFAAGFYYLPQNNHAITYDVYYGRGQVSSLVNIETRYGLWWSPPIMSTVEQNTSNNWKRPTFWTLLKAMEYWAHKEAEVMASNPQLSTDEELMVEARTFALIYAEYSNEYCLMRNSPYFPESVLFYEYDRAYGWRLGGQYSFNDKELTLNERYRTGKPWGGEPIMDVIAHEMYHAQGQWMLIAWDDGTLTFDEYINGQQNFNESVTQLLSGDAVGKALEKYGPRYAASFYSLMRSLAAGAASYYAFYDGDSFENCPASVEESQALSVALKVMGEARVEGEKVSSTWRAPYDNVCFSCEYRDILSRIQTTVNRFLWNWRQDAMQKAYWETRAVCQKIVPTFESIASKDQRLRQWLQIPEEHAEALLIYDMMPVILLTNAQEGTVTSQMYVDAFYTTGTLTSTYQVTSITAEWQEGMRAINSDILFSLWDYLKWLWKYR